MDFTTIDAELLTWVFFAGGLFLMLLETFIPGGISFFLGLSGLLVSALRYAGVMVSPGVSVGVWLVTSVLLVMAFRQLLRKYWGGSSSFKLANEDFEAMDEQVQVIEEVNALNNTGRIRYQGISWQARTEEGRIAPGTTARIKYRDNLTWIVEPIDVLDKPH